MDNKKWNINCQSKLRQKTGVLFWVVSKGKPEAEEVTFRLTEGWQRTSHGKSWGKSILGRGISTHISIFMYLYLFISLLKTMSSYQYPQFQSNTTGFILVFSFQCFPTPVQWGIWLPLSSIYLLIWSLPLSVSVAYYWGIPLHRCPLYVAHALTPYSRLIFSL